MALEESEEAAVSLFVCHNSYSTACAEYLVKRDKIEAAVLVYASGVSPKSNQIDGNIWKTIHVVKYVGSVLDNSRSLYLIFEKYKVKRLYLSNFLDKPEKLLMAKTSGDIYFLDDGLATITIFHKGFDRFFFGSDKGSYRLKYFIFCVVLLLTYRAFPFPLKRVAGKIRKYITTFPLVIPGVDTETISPPFKCKQRCVKMTRSVFFIGQNLYASPKLISHADYYARVAKVMNHYKSAGLEFCYFPHPREFDIPRVLQEKSKVIECAFESYVTEFSDEMPLVVAGFLSTALPTLKSIGVGLQVEAWRLLSEQFAEFDYIYDYFNLLGIPVLEC